MSNSPHCGLQSKSVRLNNDLEIYSRGDEDDDKKFERLQRSFLEKRAGLGRPKEQVPPEEQ